MSFTKKHVYTMLPHTERGRPVVLHGDPKGNNILYAHGNYIVCRDLANPLNAFTYTEHAKQATCAAYSPSGFYICSADVSGQVRIWDTTQEEHMLKYEYRCLGGAIKDLAWSEDSKRIVVCGEGSEVMARAFLWDSGSSVGEIVGHAKGVNSVDFKQTRPYRVCTASEDREIGFYAGPPFKFQHMNKEHDRFVNAIRYAPDGSKFLSGGADGKGFLYDGKEGKVIHQLGGDEGAHKGGIYAVSWSPDSKQAITASADKTVKLWDIEANKAVTTFTMGTEVSDQQLGCLWHNEFMVSVSLSGFINYLDPSDPSKPSRIIKGMSEPITSFAISPETGNFYAGSNEGRVMECSMETGETKVYGSGLKSKVSGMALDGGNLLLSSWDDSVRSAPVSGEDISEDSKVGCESQARGICVSAGTTVVVCQKHLAVVKDGKATNQDTSFEGLSIAASSTGDIAVGTKENKIHIFTLSGTTLTEKKVVDAAGTVEALAYSPNGKFLCSGDSSRNVFVFDTSSYDRVIDGEWKVHTAKVTCVAWSPDNKHIVSGGLDTNVFVFNVENKMKKLAIRGAHPKSNLVGVGFKSETEIFSAGHAGCVRSWTIEPIKSA